MSSVYWHATINASPGTGHAAALPSVMSFLYVFKG
jgi:hypothetical protein